MTVLAAGAVSFAVFLAIRHRYRSVWRGELATLRGTEWLSMPQTATGWLARWSAAVAPPLIAASSGGQIRVAVVVTVACAGLLVASLEHHRRTRLVRGRDLLRERDTEPEWLAYWWRALAGVMTVGGLTMMVMLVNRASATDTATLAAYWALAATTVPNAPFVAQVAAGVPLAPLARVVVGLGYVGCAGLMAAPAFLATAAGFASAAAVATYASAVCAAARRDVRRRQRQHPAVHD